MMSQSASDISSSDPRRRRRRRKNARTSSSLLSSPKLFSLSIMMMLLSLLTPCSAAQDTQSETLVYESPSLFEQLEARGEIFIDRSDRPARRDSPLPVFVVHKRDDDNDGNVVTTTVSVPSGSAATISPPPPPPPDSAPTTPPSLSDTIATDTNANLAPTLVSTSVSPSVTVVTTPLPSPFDTSLGQNFTSSTCPAFFSTFLSNSTFQSCVPVSLLLQNSNSFFRAMRSATLLTQTLDAACSAPLALCAPLMSSLASQLVSSSACGDDFKDQVATVTQAYAGLTAYEPLYRATCLRDAATDGYCFTEAVTNATTQSDSYPYYTALGLAMPNATTGGGDSGPDCTQCLRDTMKIFAGYAQDVNQPLSKTYLGCATQIDDTCGSGFADVNVKVGSVDKAESQKNGVASTREVSTLAPAVVTAVAILHMVLSTL
ncbi:uncharacterized protein PV06_05796 [Exophiala oligosperma]|uniref:DUF7729 domain-containing protein n=1 Tax=Exophiala oligosperma TaxID=215243 RepID=A0A0D2BXI4_9EURO|nr:uncharacterized protein PV06_05796 [Exophiala oligosperma]KIW42232.1 hypothetical protein PV06_05796 [Exophiala oligosperma]